jgi:hypothetical protein
VAFFVYRRVPSYPPAAVRAIFRDHSPTMEKRVTMPSNTAVQDLEDKVAKLQRAVYYLIWKRTGFGEQCVHCGHSYPGHAERCKAAEVEALVR